MFIINTLSLAYFYPEYVRFLKALNRVEKSQEKILFDIIERNKQTEFGRERDFSSINSIEDFSNKIPLSDYKDYVPYIKRARKGEENVLTAEKINLLEPTGGSSAGSKLIPYTKGLEEEYKRGIYPWLVDLYVNRPYLLNGRAYWVVTPPGDIPEKGKDKIPVDFKEDTEYLGIIGRLFEKTMAVPSKLGKINNIEEFLYLSALYLLREKNLTLISIWSPTFLLILLKKINTLWDKLLREIEEGTESEYYLPPFPSRMRELKEAKNLNSVDYSKVWKKLKLISCWADGPSQMFADRIKKEFPQVEIQGKGLLATEGIVSFPLTGFRGSILSFRSHFFEFIDRKTGEVKNASKIEKGDLYSVVITTSGGLYRYRLRDVVEVIGKIKKVPLVRFCGKENFISDFFGEKLNEFFVRKVVKRVLTKFNVKSDFQLFAPCDGKILHYCLFLENVVNDRTLNLLENELEEGLRENFHYNYARDLNQLRKVKIRLIDGSKDPIRLYTEFLINKGRKLGTIKSFLFYNKTGIEEVFS